MMFAVLAKMPMIMTHSVNAMFVIADMLVLVFMVMSLN